VRRLISLAAASASVLSILTPTVRVAAAEPAFVLRQPRTEIEAYRDPGSGQATIELPLWIEARAAAFELHVGRSDTRDPIAAIWQSPNGPRTLPTESVRSWRDYGLTGFFDLTIRGRARDAIRHRRVSWCPNSYSRTRLGPGADPSVYPQACGGNPFTRWQIWGIERGWGVGTDAYATFKLKPGHYSLEVRIPKAYRDALDLGPTLQTYELTVRDGYGYPYPPKPPHPFAGDGRGLGSPPNGPRSIGKQAPTSTTLGTDDPSTMPDLAALPAWAVRLESYGGQEVLSFAATVWNAGPAPLVVEGYRRGDEPIMDAYQVFGDEQYSSVGTFEFDAQDGHDHWHFLDFARYQLLRADEQLIVRSQKEAFCLAPTDAEDLLVPGATWRPEVIGFSECGYVDSLSIREVLQAGWGDTYFQSLPGQSFDVTGLADGDYLIEVTANPDGNLYDVSTANDRALREITLSHDARGRRRVTVAPYLGPL